MKYKKAVFGFTLTVILGVTVIGVLSGRDSAENRPVEIANQNFDSTSTSDSSTTLSFPTSQTPSGVTGQPRVIDEDVNPEQIDGGDDLVSKINGSPNSDSDSEFESPPLIDNMPEVDGISEFSNLDPRLFDYSIPSEMHRDPAEIIPRYLDPKALRSDKQAMEGNGPIIVCLMDPAYTWEEMVRYSDVIILGKVGSTVATDYPERFLFESPPGTEELGNNDRDPTDTYDTRFAFYQVEVIEILKGEPRDPFILGREDTEFYAEHCLYDLPQGERLLLFAYNHPQPSLKTDQFSNFYSTFGNSGFYPMGGQIQATQLRDNLENLLNLVEP